MLRNALPMWPIELDIAGYPLDGFTPVPCFMRPGFSPLWRDWRRSVLWSEGFTGPSHSIMKKSLTLRYTEKKHSNDSNESMYYNVFLTLIKRTHQDHAMPCHCFFWPQELGRVSAIKQPQIPLRLNGSGWVFNDDRIIRWWQMLGEKLGVIWYNIIQHHPWI